VSLVSVPTVRWTDGARVDVERIAAAVRALGAMLFVDATQSLGAMPLDVRSMPAHFIAASGYKWLLGPYGHSYLYVAPDCQDGVPLEENWIARDGADDFARLTRDKPRYRPGARRFDAGQQAGFELGAAACAALRQIGRWRVERIATALGRITDRIERCAREAGLTIASDGRRAPHILSIAADGPIHLKGLLARSRVRASVRGGMLRLSPHLFVDEDDIRRVEALIRSMAA
jgi:selenocysteine lyase/cysteine desulfurase